MIKSTFFILFSIIILAIAGCSSIYIPNVPNAPMLSQQGELHASGHVSLKGNVSFNTAYAVANHFGVLLNGSLVSNNKEKRDFKQNLIEVGGGYFTTFGAEENRILEIYTGVGRGSTNRSYKENLGAGLVTTDRQEVTFNKFFMQVNYSSKKQKDLRLFGKQYPLNYGTMLRVSHITMNEFLRNDIAQPKEDNIFLEPVFFTRMVLSDAVQLQYSTGSNFGLRNRKFLTAGNSVFTLGLVINVGGKNMGLKTKEKKVPGMVY